ncbi:MAG: pyridoxamine 5-phosphate oxidase [Pseudomonadota bacterium]
MSQAPKSPIRETDDEARRLASELLEEARYGALGVLSPSTGLPHVTRVAIARDPDGAPMSLMSELSSHTSALLANPACSLLLGRVHDKGDPLVHPRMTLACTAMFTMHENEAYQSLRAHYLLTQPKAQLYIDFTDFHFATFRITQIELNGGFGKAYHLTPEDIGLSVA